MKTQRILCLLAPCATLATLSLVGCGPSAPTGTDNATQNGSSGGNRTSSNGNTTTSGGKQLKLAFVTNGASDFWTVARKGVEKAESELPNVQVDFRLPDAEAAAQTSVINDLLAKGIDGMAISPIDPKNQGPILDKAADQVLVFTQDSDAPDSKRACYIGTDNVAAGRQAGEALKKALPNGGDVLVFVGKKDAQNAKDRYQGVVDAVKGSKVKILDIRTDNNDLLQAKANVSDALVKYPKLAACVGLWSYNGPAILAAVRSAKKIGQVKIVCFDEETDTLNGVKAGEIEATVVQQPYEFGYQSVVNMSKYLNGDKSVIPASKQIFVPTKLITKAEVEAFRTQLNKLRGK